MTVHDETGSPWKAAPREIYRWIPKLYLNRILLETKHSILETKKPHKKIKLHPEIKD